MQNDIGLKDLAAMGLLGVVIYAVFGNIGLAIFALILLFKYSRKEKA